jgi:LacI family transcriptional regulator
VVALGGAAAERLLRAIAGDHTPGVHPHPAKLVIRDSTVPA